MYVAEQLEQPRAHIIGVYQDVGALGRQCPKGGFFSRSMSPFIWGVIHEARGTNRFNLPAAVRSSAATHSTVISGSKIP